MGEDEEVNGDVEAEDEAMCWESLPKSNNCGKQPGRACSSAARRWKQTGGDLDKAVAYLREKGMAALPRKRGARRTKAGWKLYSPRPGNAGRRVLEAELRDRFRSQHRRLQVRWRTTWLCTWPSPVPGTDASPRMSGRRGGNAETARFRDPRRGRRRKRPSWTRSWRAAWRSSTRRHACCGSHL